MSVTLVTFGKNGVRKDFEVADRPFIIGRQAEADLRIPRPEVSRTHCEIVQAGKKISLRDLSSSNGTFVNEHKVAETTLKAGDRIKVGPVVFVVQVDGLPAKITPAALATASRPAAAGAAARPQVPTGPAPAAAGSKAGDDTDAFDIDELGELDIDDLSDIDLDDIGEGSAEAEELEEIDEADLIPDEEEKPKGPKKK